jgi:uncharacterized protein
MISKVLLFMVGLIFGFTFIKAEVVSWFRILEMFRFESFHMYGVIGTAVVVGAFGVLLIKKLNLKSLSGQEIIIEKRPFTKGTVIGGLLFGLGWAITGACPGPIFALIGAGYPPFIVVLLSALAGTWVYGALKSKLPH